MTALERAAQAFEDALRDPSGLSVVLRYGSALDCVTLDGTFDLLAAMRAALAVIRKPTPHMILGLEQLSYAADPGEAVDYWTTMIDAILEEKPEG